MEEIGRRLRKAREAKGLTLEVVEDETKIRRKYIEALEAGQEAVLPGDAYLKGFLRTYGNYLGLDGTALVEAYKQAREHHGTEGHGAGGSHRAPHREPDPAPRAQPAPQPEPVMPVKEQAAAIREPARVRRETSAEAQPAARRETVAAPQPAIRREEVLARAERQAGRARRNGLKKESGALRTIGGAAIVVALIGAVCYLGWLIFSQGAPKAKEQEPAPTPPPAASTQQPAQTTTPPPPLPEPAKVTMSRANDMDVVFAVPAKEITVQLEIGKVRLWYSAAVDGKTVSETVSTPATKEFKGSDIRIQVGHMEDVSVVVNGQRFDKPLTSGPYNLIFKGQ